MSQNVCVFCHQPFWHKGRKRFCGKEYFVCANCGDKQYVNRYRQLHLAWDVSLDDLDVKLRGHELILPKTPYEVDRFCDKCYASKKGVLLRQQKRKTKAKIAANRPETKKKLKVAQTAKYGNYAMLQPYAREKSVKARGTKEFRKKVEQTTLRRYGVKNVMQRKDFIDRAVATNKQNHGGVLAFHTSESRIKSNALSQTKSAKQRRKETMVQKYGVEYYCTTEKCRKQRRLYSSDSSISTKIEKALKTTTRHVFIREKQLERRFYDLCNERKRILVEVNPNISHSYVKSFESLVFDREKTPIKKAYHLEKSLLAEKHGYFCFQYFNDYYDNKILNKIIKNEIQKKQACTARLEKTDSNDASKYIRSFFPCDETLYKNNYLLLVGKQVIGLISLQKDKAKLLLNNAFLITNLYQLLKGLEISTLLLNHDFQNVKTILPTKHIRAINNRLSKVYFDPLYSIKVCTSGIQEVILK